MTKIYFQGVGCIVIGIIVHWATLSAFLSMMAEAFSVYYAIVVVFDSHIRYVTLKLIAFCYGKSIIQQLIIIIKLPFLIRGHP